jgi:hypothetical protein
MPSSSSVFHGSRVGARIVPGARTLSADPEVFGFEREFGHVPGVQADEIQDDRGGGLHKTHS